MDGGGGGGDVDEDGVTIDGVDVCGPSGRDGGGDGGRSGGRIFPEKLLRSMHFFIINYSFVKLSLKLGVKEK